MLSEIQQTLSSASRIYLFLSLPIIPFTHSCGVLRFLFVSHFTATSTRCSARRFCYRLFLPCQELSELLRHPDPARGLRHVSTLPQHGHAGATASTSQRIGMKLSPTQVLLENIGSTLRTALLLQMASKYLYRLSMDLSPDRQL